MKYLMRLLGVRMVESPEAVRVTLPKWMVRLMPDLPNRTREKVQRENPHYVSVRVVNRSVIARIR